MLRLKWYATSCFLSIERPLVELSSQSVESVNTGIRISDGAQVTVKILTEPKHTNQIHFGRLFSSPPHNSDPKNHCVPVYDVLEMPEKGLNFIVMPYLSFWEIPPFGTIGEVVECIRQMFEVSLELV